MTHSLALEIQPEELIPPPRLTPTRARVAPIVLPPKRIIAASPPVLSKEDAAAERFARLAGPVGKLTGAYIVKACAAYWGVGIAQIKGPSRILLFTLPRVMAYHLIRKHTQLSLSRIALQLGRRDHTTVLSGIRRAKYLIAHEVFWQTALAALEAKILQPVTPCATA